MKTRFLTRFSGLTVLAGILCGMALISCNHEGKPLHLYGIWQEKDFIRYDPWLDSTSLDTLKHLSHSQHRLVIECAQQADSGEFNKTGNFMLTIASWHDSSYRDPNRYWYNEYVKGTYLLDERHHKLRLDGLYYTDENFTTVATDSMDNYHYSVGAYKTRSDYYLNDKFFTVSLNDSTRSDINTFFPVQLYDNCL